MDWVSLFAWFLRSPSSSAWVAQPQPSARAPGSGWGRRRREGGSGTARRYQRRHCSSLSLQCSRGQSKQLGGPSVEGGCFWAVETGKKGALAPGGGLAGLGLRERLEHLSGGVGMGSFLAVSLSLPPLTFPGSVHSCVPFRAPQAPSSGAVGHSCGCHLPRR